MTAEAAFSLVGINPETDGNQPGYTSEECRNILQAYREYYPKVGYHKPWIGYFVKKGGALVGTCGFVGPPANGRVEIAYMTFPKFEGRGVASYACGALLDLARQAGPALVVTAKTAPETNASTRILQRHGFRFTGIVQDHEIGDAWEWECRPGG